jgi:sugar-specific transcriptional regulator TrmB
VLCKKCTLCYAYGMLMDNSSIGTYFAKLGLDQEVADIYLALYTHGPQQIAALSRSSGVERTRIYRLIDTLLDSNLIELDASQSRGTIKAAPISNLRLLINKRAEELKNLTDELALLEQVLSRNSLAHGHTRMQFFPGPEGIRQLIRHILQKTTEVVGYTSPNLLEVLGIKFSKELSKEQQAGLIKLQHKEIALGQTQGHSCYVYDDIVAYVYIENDTYGFEIHDPEMAKALRYSVTSISRQNAM